MKSRLISAFFLTNILHPKIFLILLFRIKFVFTHCTFFKNLTIEYIFNYNNKRVEQILN